MDVSLVGGGETEVTVDSGAEENVCPKEWRQQYGLIPAKNKINLRGAKGDVIEHYGSRQVVVSSIF